MNYDRNMIRYVKVTSFLMVLFNFQTADEAVNFFNGFPDYIGVISLADCLKCIYFKELFLDDSWKQTDVFIPPTVNNYKVILRDLLDLGYIVCCPDNMKADEVYEMSFLLFEQGLLCIASELFISALNSISGMYEVWEQQKDSIKPNLRQYVTKFYDKDENLNFIKGFFPD